MKNLSEMLPRALIRAVAALAVAAAFAVAFGLAPVSANAAYAEEATSAEDGVLEGYAYREYISDREPSASEVGYGSLSKDTDNAGKPLSLLVNGEETVMPKGLFAHAHSWIAYTDIQDYGYERFEAWVGINATQRGNANSSVAFRVWADGEVVWESGQMGANDDAKRVSVDLAGVHVLQLEADDLGANGNDHAVWGDAAFYKAEATPYLAAYDKEFANPEQVTDANILEGVFARTLGGAPGDSADEDSADGRALGDYGYPDNGKSGNDLTDSVTYTTDYTPGATGAFAITYRVQDASGAVRERSVAMTVRSAEVYRANADIDYVTTPFASFQYMGRDYFDEQGKKAWDYCVDRLLHFGDYAKDCPVVWQWGESVAKVTLNLQEQGIYMKPSEAGYLVPHMMDDEPRMFHLKDWGTEVTKKGALVETVTFYVPQRYAQGDYYNERLMAIEENASRFLSNIEEGMTDAQRLRAVLYPYADWIKYEGGGQLMDEALADGRGVCGGNARGSIYLSQRMGIKAYWVRTVSHAWSNVKLNRPDGGYEGAYYRIDLLARPGCFLSKDNPSGLTEGNHHGEVVFTRHKGWPDMTEKDYPFAWTAWPSLTIKAEEAVSVIAPADRDTFDVRSLLLSCSSVYDGDLSDAVEIDDGGLEAKATEAGYAPGYYEVAFSVRDSRGNSATASCGVRVVDEEVGDAAAMLEDAQTEGDALAQAISLWDGEAEHQYAQGIRMHEAASAVFNVEGKGYTAFDAWVGIKGSVRQNVAWGANGKVQLEVWVTTRDASGAESEPERVWASSVMGWYTPEEHAFVSLPSNAVSVKLVNVPKGSGNNHAGWGNPRFYSDENIGSIPRPPVISGVQDGAVYEPGTQVVPAVENAVSATLYRKDLPVMVEPAAALLAADALPQGADADDAALFAAFADPEWGDVVEGYEIGDAVTEEGRYTLVAVGEEDTQAIARFNIGTYKTEEPVAPVNTGALASAIMEAEGIEQGEKTNQAFADLKAAIERAKAALEAAESQEAVDAATSDLEKAVEDFKASEDAADPEEPDNQDNPDNPDNPGGSTDPDEPGDPDNPDNPGEPTDPDEPDNPGEPGEPEEPGDPDEPGVPTDPEEPSDPGDHGGSGEPTGPEEPSDPDEPGEPDNPDNPGDPADPDEPTGPDNPDEPANPEDPDNPDNPGDSGEPDDPAAPDDSTDSDNPDGSDDADGTDESNGPDDENGSGGQGGSDGAAESDGQGGAPSGENDGEASDESGEGAAGKLIRTGDTTGFVALGAGALAAAALAVGVAAAILRRRFC